jgi:hypothetical protein
MKRTRFFAAVAVSLLAGSAALVPGCGLGTVGIILAATMSGGDDDTPYVPPTVETPTVLFEEDFETGLARWSLAGPALPLAAAGGATGLGLDPQGTSTGNGEAVSRVAFNLDAGLSVKGSLRVPLLGASNADLWFGIKNACAADGNPTLLAGFFLSGAQSQARMLVGSVVQATWALPDTEWHEYQVWVRPDSRVEYYVDGGLVGVSADRTDPLADSLPVTAGGRSLGAAVRLDDVEVFGYRPARDVLLGESFGTDLSAWTTAGSGTAPSIDPFLQGNPSPALNPGGGAAGDGFIVSTDTFTFGTKGLEIRGDLYVSALGVAGIEAEFGLKEPTAALPNPWLAGVQILGGSDEIHYVRNGADFQVEPLPSAGWHSFRIVILPPPAVGSPCPIQFHRDGRLVALTATGPDAGTAACPLSAGGDNSSGMARIDNLAVLQPPHVEVPTWAQAQNQGSAPVSSIQGHALVWDRKRGRAVVLCGGPSTTGGDASSEVFELPVSGTSAVWSRLQPSGGGPAARIWTAAAYSTADDSVYLAMGSADAAFTSSFQDLWRLDFSSSPQGAWTQVLANWGAAGPSARYGHSAAFDSRQNRILVACGRDSSTVHIDAWAFPVGGTAWVSLGSPGVGASARAFQAAAYDEANDRLVIAGGADGTDHGVADVFWCADLSQDPPSWFQAIPPGQEGVVSGGEGRFRWAAAADTYRRRLYLYGGRNSTTEFADLHDLDLAGGSDGVLSADVRTFGSLPASASGAAMVYDPAGKRLVLVGGSGAAATVSLGDIKE